MNIEKDMKALKNFINETELDAPLIPGRAGKDNIIDSRSEKEKKFLKSALKCMEARMDKKMYKQLWIKWEEYLTTPDFHRHHGEIDNRKEISQWGFRWFYQWLLNAKALHKRIRSEK